MNISVLLFLLIFILTKESAASPQFESGDDSSLWLLNLLESGADAIGKFPDLFKAPEDTIPEPPTPAPGSPNKPVQAVPNSNILPSNTQQTQQDDQQKPQARPGTATDCDPNYSISSDPSCQSATSQIIYPRKCEQSDALTSAINDVIKPKVVKSFIDNRCGVSFYSASLTQIEKSEISKMKSVKIVATNRKIDGPQILRDPNPIRVPDDQNDPGVDMKKSLKNDQKTDAEDSLANVDNLQLNDRTDSNVDATSPDFKIKRNIIDYVIERADGLMGNLAFISTPIRRKLLNRYLSFRKSGHGTRLYLMCSGVDATHRTFLREPFVETPGAAAQNGRSEAVIKSQINAVGTTPFGIPDENYMEGTCTASIAIGDPFGVTLYSDLVVVKIVPTVESFMDGWLQVLNDLENQALRNPSRPLEGYTVVETHHSWFESRDMSTRERLELMAHEEQVEQYLSSLITDWQVVVVVSAASNSQENSGRIDTFPAHLSTQEEFPIIVVGAVKIDGSREAFSPGGAALTISAPSRALCAGIDGNDEQSLYGTVIAAAHVGGLALYFLSLGGLGDEIRARKPVARTLRDFMLYKAYPRAENWPLAIWNGLNSYIPGSYGWDYAEFFQGRKKT